jgi:hypothetical protein
MVRGPFFKVKNANPKDPPSPRLRRGKEVRGQRAGRTRH